MTDPAPGPGEPPDAAPDSFPPDSGAGRYWSVSSAGWDRSRSALAEEYAALLAPPIVVGANRSLATAGRHRRPE